VSALYSGRDLRVPDELVKEDSPVSQDKVASARPQTTLGKGDQCGTCPLTAQKLSRLVEIVCVAMILGVWIKHYEGVYIL
jgi:hypothetical protein